MLLARVHCPTTTILSVNFALQNFTHAYLFFDFAYCHWIVLLFCIGFVEFVAQFWSFSSNFALMKVLNRFAVDRQLINSAVNSLTFLQDAIYQSLYFR